MTNLDEQEMPFQRGEKAYLRWKALHGCSCLCVHTAVFHTYLAWQRTPRAPTGRLGPLLFSLRELPAERDEEAAWPFNGAVNTRITFFKSNFL